MFRPLARSHRRTPRRGTVVVITIFALITILMVLGLAFMMYAVKEKAVAQAHKDGANVAGTGAPDPTDTINRFLSTLVYDENDDGDSLHNSLRGHSIARAMYGGRRDASSPWVGSTVPWAGVGTFHENAGGYGYPALTAGTDRGQFVNHTAMVLNSTPFLIDPEWTGRRSVASNAFAAFLADQTGRSYVGKHAGYTYPDLKNFFLGARDPATGEVLVPSFHREWLFGSLAPTNPNWSSDVGRLKTLRPRRNPQEHPNFPSVPPNPDGTYTGDVQNLSGAVGVQKNDSLWMHIGLRPRTLADGRVVQPLVAPLILPLDGLFDLSTHGNQFGTGNAHVSYGGYAPWEINPIYGLTNDTERQELLQWRNPSYATAFDRYTSGRPLPRYSSVIWPSPASLATPINFTLPTGGSLTGLPSSADPAATPAAFGSFRNDNAAVLHPAGYNPNEFAMRSDTFSDSPIFPYTDIKRLSLRYAFTPDWYSLAFVSKPSNSRPTFYGTPGTYPYITNPGATTAHSYRLDPAHRSRLLFNTRSSSLDRPAIAPNFVARDGAAATAALALGNGSGGLTKPGSLLPAATAYPTPGGVGSVTDFAANNQWVHAQAALGSVNLNRPLADYRADPNLPLSNANVNVNTAALADQDRQSLAKDIFARLIVALGAAGQVSFNNGVVITLPDPLTFVLTPSSGAPITYTQQQYWALRYLAQLAVNIVDYIDNDDVSTVFVWNPPASGTADFTNPADVGNRVVFGTEKPRLVINEVYSEITNGTEMTDGVDGPLMGGMNQALPNTAQAHVKFWTELLNPTMTPHANPPALPGTPAAGVPQGIFGTGGVNLSAYQIQIARQQRRTGGAAMPRDQLSALLTPTDPDFQSNVTGRFVEAADTTFTFPSSPLPNQPGSVEPNNAQYLSPAPTNLPLNGVVLVGPEVTAKTPPATEFNPPNAGVWATANKVTSPATAMGKSALSTGMGYTLDMPPVATLGTDEFRRHTVLLRRLANPYLQPNDPLITPGNNAIPINPYVTVDMMNEVPAFDAVHRAQGQATNRGARTVMNSGGYDPLADRFSIGKVQPLAGRAVATVPNMAGTYNAYQFANSMVLAQTTMPTMPPPTPDPNEPKNTFGRQNGNAGQPGQTLTATAGVAATISDTIMTPFDWLQHMDRPLETLGDILFARDSKPYLLTNEFVRNTATGLVYTDGYGRWAFHEDGLARALELLTVKSPSSYVAHGGRMSGKINVNVMQDRRIALGLWDAPVTVTTGNRFNQAFVNNTIWGDLTLGTPVSSWMNTRTPLQLRNTASGAAADQVSVPVPNQQPNGTPAPSYTDTVSGNGSDRPFLPFGAPSATVGTFAYGAGSNIGDTILRSPAGPNPALPFLYQTAETNPYTQTEPFRKVVSNVTTVSHAFVVYLTIGYFDVTFPPAPGGWPNNVAIPAQFGAEVYDKIPGDMRQKYVAVVDMSNMALKPAFPYTGDPDTSSAQALEQPFFTVLTETARPSSPAQISFVCQGYDATGTGTLYVAADGQRRPIGANTTLVLGYGAETQVVTVTNNPVVFDTTTGIGSVQVTGLVRTAWGGTCVSNVRPGYAGPQPAFDFTLPKYKPVVPYVERLK
ncbi:hypothetical protein VT84_36040 [Gemmata sp. SH-PL17]|uniref:hypothetical protein n=1 Tax=Gemmata sp. SH-PL17 TaxID=1630693 RepID=UPI00078BDF9F|nr:hypothetical protein [Gemmata sp. SH-PL17]AMV29861.1 hypothetical protein VT84_36040 [Gemmata sp. SH-PL17]